MYSSMLLWTSRWFGARFVTTATSAELVIVISWNELSSTTAKSSGDISFASGSNGWPMFPPIQTFFPACSRIFAINVVVVVLPSEPVTAMRVHGQTSKNASISEVSCAPPSVSRRICGRSGRIPGVRNTTSASSPSR